MGRMILHLDYGSRIVEDLQEVWIQESMTSIGWCLCYEDRYYEKYVVYRSSNLQLLRQLKQKFLEAYANNEKQVTI